MKRLEIHTELVRNILTRFIRDEVKKAGFGKVIVGLSGGIDSAVSAALAAEALGPENVIAFALPHKKSNPQSLADGELLAKEKGLDLRIIDITPAVEGYLSQLSNPGKLRIGNVMARTRMMVLYDQSVVHNGLVLGTSNKTEFLLGYTTQYGDMASALNPIGDLYKTQLRQLAKAIRIPASIVEKAPSADLWEGQTDEGELGFTYAEVDKLLYLWIDLRYTVQDLLEEGFSRKFIDAVMARVRKNQFKRKLPLIAKLSQRTIDKDFHYLRDWGL